MKKAVTVTVVALALALWVPSASATLLSGAHNASKTLSPPTKPKKKSGLDGLVVLAQGYYSPGFRYAPRYQRRPDYDRDYREREGYITPEDRYGNIQRRWEFRGAPRYGYQQQRGW